MLGIPRTALKVGPGELLSKPVITPKTGLTTLPKEESVA